MKARWVAKKGRWAAKKGRWVNKNEAKLTACMLLWRPSGFESRHLSIIQNGRYKQRSGQHTVARQKIYLKTKLEFYHQSF
jgi:hypothetical protein